jgi:NADH dehydrogenase
MRREIDCTVVTRDNFHAFHGFISEMLTGRLAPGNLLSPVRRMFNPASVHVGEVERIDLDQHRVVSSRHLDGRRTVHHYDHLVLALGTTDRLDVYPGLAEHAFTLKAYPDTFRLRNHILEMLELAEIEEDDEERRRLLTFFIAGGGFAGTEVAGELADFVRRLAGREFPRIRFEECRFALVHPGPTILPELYGKDGTGRDAHPKLIEKGAARQRELGVEVWTNTRVAAVTPSEVALSSGERIPTRTVISAVGSKANPVIQDLPLEKDERGRVVAGWTGLVPGRSDVWAGGDCAALPKPGGGTCPPVALYALKHGTLIGRNIARIARGQKPRRFVYPGIGQGASVGRRYAVAELKGLEFWGLPAWLVWRAMLTYYFPSTDRRLRILADWLIWPLVGRDIVQMRVDRPANFELRENLYQDGETIAEEGKVSRHVHVIVEGEVEIFDQHDGAERLLKTLGPGDQFGIRWMESFEPEQARAKGVVRTMAIRRDQAPGLQQVLASASRIIAESGHFPVITREMEEAASRRRGDGASEQS